MGVVHIPEERGGITDSLETLDDLVHVHQLAVIRLKGELDLHSPDIVQPHGGFREKRGRRTEN